MPLETICLYDKPLNVCLPRPDCDILFEGSHAQRIEVRRV
jgi:hypothetical protein